MLYSQMWAFFFKLLTQHQPLFYSKLFPPDKQYGTICCLTVQHTATHRCLFCRSYIDKITQKVIVHQNHP